MHADEIYSGIAPPSWRSTTQVSLTLLTTKKTLEANYQVKLANRGITSSVPDEHYVRN